MKLKPFVHGQTGQLLGYNHWCPGCNSPHGIYTAQHNSSRPIWQFDGNMESPTFAPSIRCSTRENGVVKVLCHYFIKGGNIEYCSDSPHEFSGQIVPLPEWPTNWD